MKNTIFALFILMFPALLPTNVFADISQFAGQWQNADSKTRGITNIEISNEEEKIAVQIFGRCHPTDCIWKRSYATVYAPAVESDLLKDANALSIVYDQGFAQVIVTLRIIKGDKIRAEVFTRFTDQSKRANTFYTHIFARKIKISSSLDE